MRISNPEKSYATEVLEKFQERRKNKTENGTVDFTSNPTATEVDESKKAIAQKVESYKKQIKDLEQKLEIAKNEYQHMENGFSKKGGAVIGGTVGALAGSVLLVPIVAELIVAGGGPIAWGAALLAGVLTTAGGAAYGYNNCTTPESEAKHAAKEAYYNNVIKPLESQIDNLYKAMQEEMNNL